jgi:hypothetical protein
MEGEGIITNLVALFSYLKAIKQVPSTFWR